MNPAKLLAITRAFLSQRALMNYLSREGGVRPRPFFSLSFAVKLIYVTRAFPGEAGVIFRRSGYN